jgi:hypothetical protein
MAIDEDEEKQINQAEPMDDEQLAPAKTPSENDFMAGAMLANGIVFVWMQLLSIFRQTASEFPQGVLVDISYLIYIFAGYISTRQVVKRTGKEHLKIGFKTAGYSSIMGLLIIFTLTKEPTMNFAIILAVCYFAGSILASYLELRARIRNLGS